MEITSELKQLLKALRLSTLLTTLPERVAYAKGNKLTHLELGAVLLGRPDYPFTKRSLPSPLGRAT